MLAVYCNQRLVLACVRTGTLHLAVTLSVFQTWSSVLWRRAVSFIFYSSHGCARKTGLSCSSLHSVIEPLQSCPRSAFYVDNASVILDLVDRLSRGPPSRLPLRYGFILWTVKPVLGRKYTLPLPFPPGAFSLPSMEVPVLLLYRHYEQLVKLRPNSTEWPYHHISWPCSYNRCQNKQYRWGLNHLH